MGNTNVDINESMKQKLIYTGMIGITLFLGINLLEDKNKEVHTEVKKVEFSYTKKDLEKEILQLKKYKQNQNHYEYKLHMDKLRKEDAVRKAESNRESTSSELGTFNVSFYSIYCEGCTGITASGIDVRNTTTYEGYKIAASDWNVIPPYSIIEVEGYGQFIILDKGGAIKGNRLDLLVSTEKEAYSNGRQYLKVKLIRKGKG